MNEEIANLVRGLDKEPGASEEALRRAQSDLGISLPSDYASFMMESNGAEGLVGISFLQLDPLENLGPRNQRLQSTTFTPGLIVFGSNGGGTAYAFDTRVDPMSVVAMDFITIDPNAAKVVAPTFTGFLKYLNSRP